MKSMHIRSLIKNKDFEIISIIVAVLAFLAIPSYIWTKKNVSTLADRYNSPLNPTIMIPGSGAGADRFDKLLHTVNSQYDEHHSILHVTVHTNNKVTYSGRIQPGDNRPYIVVGFQNSKDGYQNIKKQAVWFNIAFKDLVNRYRFNQFNAFGHSNGGLVWTYFLENDFNDSIMKLHHFMTIGTPYNLEETNLDNRTEMLNELIKNRKKLPTDISYYSIAGTKLYTDDGIVPLGSVDAGKYIYEGQIKRYTLVTLTGSNAEHSDMLLNPQFINIFQQYIVKVSTKDSNTTQLPT